MSPVVEPTATPQPPAPFVTAFAERRSITMLALGFSAGLPVVLIFDTLSLWLRGRGVSLETIGFLSLVTLVYSFKARLHRTPSPRTRTETSRMRGPSSSTRKTRCQHPSCRRPSAKFSDADDPSSRAWQCA
jgi:hypothetical protein